MRLRHPTKGLSQSRAQNCGDWQDTLRNSFYGGTQDLWGWDTISTSSQVELLFSSWHQSSVETHRVADMRLYIFYERDENSLPESTTGREVGEESEESSSFALPMWMIAVVAVAGAVMIASLAVVSFFLFRRRRVKPVDLPGESAPSSIRGSFQETEATIGPEVYSPSPTLFPTDFEQYSEVRLLDPSELRWGKRLGEGAYGVVQLVSLVL